MAGIWDDQDGLSNIVGNFLRDKHIQKCEVCDVVNEWSIYVVGDATLASLHYKRDGEIREGTNSLSLVCLNCGNVRLMASDVIEKWQEDQSSE